MNDWLTQFSVSTISSALSGMSLIMLEDFIKKKVKLTDNEATKISKVIGEFRLREAYSLMWFNNLVCC